MDDLSFRAQFHRALDPTAPPAPWLAATLRETLRQRRRAMPVRTTHRLAAPAWLLPAVAVLLLVAILIAVVVGGRLLHFNQPVPVRPPQHGLAAPAACPTWTSQPAGGSLPASDRMTSPSVGWTHGALRTTDGGAVWHDVAPNDMWSDAPPRTSPTAYPPGYVDYFLDSNHAWLAYSYPSRTSCFDHVTVFSTVDGGRTWKRSHPVNAAVQADASLQLQMFFLDSQHGWLMVLGSGRLAPDWFVYTTSNGGLDWHLLAQLPQMSSWCSVQFVTLTVGFLGGCSNSSGPAAQLTVTRDSGRTWEVINLATTPGTQNSVGDPVFSNPDQGIVLVTGYRSQGNATVPFDYLSITSDGGQTWRTSPAPLPGYPRAFAAIDLTHFVADFADSNGFDFIARTADGGQTWVRAGALPIVVPSNPNILVVDPQHLFIEDMGQTIGDPPLDWLVTMDGGQTWKDVRPRLS